ncbi:MAG: GNAT family N-acetyltransferase [Ruminiclostridium sp.]|nr:GNAT family N-acetyltransferase [Ruminiclostridium sp.]
MNEEIKIKKLDNKNIKAIVNWCKDKDADFLMQWAGAGYIYPLTEEQISKRLYDGAQIFEAQLNGEIAGTVEIIHREEQYNSALIGRFVIDPSITSKGIGTKIMLEFLEYCKEKLGISEVSLCVFDFNIGAYKCYQKCGFTETGSATRPNGWKAITMRKTL